MCTYQKAYYIYLNSLNSTLTLLAILGGAIALGWLLIDKLIQSPHKSLAQLAYIVLYGVLGFYYLVEVSRW